MAEVVTRPETVRALCDRNFGVGGDGVLAILPGEAGVARMRVLNADGSEAEMCGNGVRCLAKLAWDSGRCPKNPMRVQTGGGVKTIQLNLNSAGKATSATVDMGEPVLAGEKIPVKLRGEQIVDAPLEVGGKSYRMTCVSMGNPHAVIYVDSVRSIPLEQIGPLIERHGLFPARVNAHFVQVLSAGEVIMRTWERGSGITLACGTGASAVCVAGVLTGRSGRNLLAHLPGGDLKLEWRQSDNRVYLTGPAVEVFSGTWPEQGGPSG
jgi:diaminopimelate epimerase